MHEGNNICKTFFCRIDRDTITPLSQLGQQPNDFSLQRRTISLSVELDWLTDWLCSSLLRRWSIYLCLWASQTPITIHILKDNDEGYSKIIREHKYKYKDNDKDNDKDKDTDKVPETLNICYVFEILMTHSFQIWWLIPHPGHPGHPVYPGYPVSVILSVLQGRVYHRFGIFSKWVSKTPFVGSNNFRKDSAWRKRFEAEINSTPTEVWSLLQFSTKHKAC